MIKDAMKALTAYDKEVGEAMQLEFNRQNRNLELIASENIVSAACNACYGKYILQTSMQKDIRERDTTADARMWMLLKILQ